MKKLAIITATRAEYGLLAPLIKELRKNESDELRIELVVTGTHLSYDFGNTVESIDDRVDKKILIPVKSSNAIDIANNQAITLIKFTELFVSEKYNGVVLLGDRYEMLSVAIAAGNTMTPIFHLFGGDTTEGAIDEWIRHSITKISYVHFVSNADSYKRVIQLGENPKRVFNYGSTCLDNILTVADMTKAEALTSIGLDKSSAYVICTFHPVTLELENLEFQIHELLKAIQFFPRLEFVMTKANADEGGSRINAILDDNEKIMENLHVYASLGTRRYLSLMKHCELVLGNSSSGIMEAPYMHIPTVNIGDRQKGRVQSGSVINCGYSCDSIVAAIKKVLTKEHKELCRNNNCSVYGDGKAAKKISDKIIEILNTGDIHIIKKFYDLS